MPSGGIVLSFVRMPSSEKIIIEDNWHPLHYEKFPDKISFLTEQLQQIFFLKHLTRKETRMITNAMRPMSILAGECLVTERHSSDTFYIITNGSCFVSTEERGKISDIPAIDPDFPGRPESPGCHACRRFVCDVIWHATSRESR